MSNNEASNKVLENRSKRTKAKNGDGCWIKVKNGYKYKKQHGFKADGKPLILVTTGKTEKECRAKMEKRISDIKQNMLTADTCAKLTLSELCYKHLDTHLSEAERLKPKSADRREGSIRNQVENYPIGSLQVSSISSWDIDRHIEGLISAKKLSISSIVKAYNVINSAFKWAISQQMLSYNPCVAIHDKLINRFSNLRSKKSVNKEIIVLSSDEILLFKAESKRLCKNGKPKYRVGAASRLLLETGLRVGELCALIWSDWDRESHTLSITKTRFTAIDRTVTDGPKYKTWEGEVKNCHWREIELSKEAEEILNEIYLSSPDPSPTGHIILNRSQKPTNPSKFIECLNRIFKAANILDDHGNPIYLLSEDDISGAHIFRRTCATNMHNNGISTLDIAAYLGDTEETIIKHYISTKEKIKVGNKTKNIVPFPTPKIKD